MNITGWSTPTRCCHCSWYGIELITSLSPSRLHYDKSNTNNTIHFPICTIPIIHGGSHDGKSWKFCKSINETALWEYVTGMSSRIYTHTQGSYSDGGAERKLCMYEREKEKRKWHTINSLRYLSFYYRVRLLLGMEGVRLCSFFL